MRCEVSVMQLEHHGIKEQFMQQKKARQKESDRIETKLRYLVRIQSNAINHLQSLIQAHKRN